jgi:hypothetical protein
MDLQGGHPMHGIKVGVMQPYFFPYIGYYQLVHAVDTFVFYDDVNFINRGWINRNRILINGQPSYITVALSGASQNKAICEIPVLDDGRKILRSIEMAYRKAPYFQDAFDPIAQVLTGSVDNIGELAARSVTVVMDHLGIRRDFLRSSESFPETRGMERADRLIAITKACGGVHYVNAPGGETLYDKEEFRARGVELHFLQPVLPTYPQFGNTFQPGLSIVDVLMFNPVETVRTMLQNANLDRT